VSRTRAERHGITGVRVWGREKNFTGKKRGRIQVLSPHKKGRKEKGTSPPEGRGTRKMQTGIKALRHAAHGAAANSR